MSQSSSFQGSKASSMRLGNGHAVSLDDLLVSYESEVTTPRINKARDMTSDASSKTALASSSSLDSTIASSSSQATSAPTLNENISSSTKTEVYWETTPRTLETSVIKDEPMTVAGLCRSISGALVSLGRVSVIGEVSNFKGATSKGAFFCIKGTDETSVKKEKIAVVNVSVWSTVWNTITENSAISDGVSVVVSGTVRYYEPYGRLSIVADEVELAGEGILRRRFQELFGRLSAEGLFAPERKKTLPSSFKRIALMTARQGQAVRDVLNSITRQDPFMEVYLFPCLVQGRDAPTSLINTLEMVNSYHVSFDAVLVVRGGGSFEDLDCFNDERWIRYAAEYNRLPLISGVGHEGDHTLTEYLADYGAITPTAAAEFVARPMYNRIQRFRNMTGELQAQIKLAYDGARRKRDELSRRMALLSPEALISHNESMLLSLQDRLSGNVRLELVRLEKEIETQKARLYEYSPKVAISHREELLQAITKRFNQAFANESLRHTQEIEALQRRLATFANTVNNRIETEDDALGSLQQRYEGAIGRVLAMAKERLGVACKLLDAKSPLKVLAEGYTYTENLSTNKSAVAAELKTGDTIRTVFAGGVAVESVVTTTAKNIWSLEAKDTIK